MNLIPPETWSNLATCQRCGTAFGHPGPCHRCVPPGGVRLDRAMRLAAEFHALHFRKGRGQDGCAGVNFLVHPAMMVHSMWEHGLDPSRDGILFEVAWLHDAAEDWGLPGPEPVLDRVAREHCRTVAMILRELTRTGSKTSYKNSFAPEHRPPKSVESLIVKVFDQDQNARDFLVTDPRAAQNYVRGATPVFRGFAARRGEIEAYLDRPFSQGQQALPGRAICQRIDLTIDELMMLVA